LAFDVYVGTLTRFYGEDWENVAERMAREQRIEYNKIYAIKKPGTPPPKDEIRESVKNWCLGLTASLKEHGFGPVAWDEDDHMPYFTDRPNWDGYGGLLVWAAHAEHPELELPSQLPETWADDEAYQRSIERELHSRYRSILAPQLWLPVEFPFVFEAPTLTADQDIIGSVFTLKQQLDELQDETGEKLSALTSLPKPQAESSKPSGFLAGVFSRKQPPAEEKPSLSEAAEFGLSVFRELAAKACEHRLPMVLDY